jgi:hypothetical protein
MKFPLFLSLHFLIAVAASAGDTLFVERFSSRGLPAQLTYSSNAEAGHLVGVDKSDFLRLHPRSNGFVRLPEILIPPQGATLYYDWKKSGTFLPDTFAIEITNDGVNFLALSSVQAGTGRAWVQDSLNLQPFAGQQVSVIFRHQTAGVFPSQYLNLDNLLIIANDVTSNIRTELLGVSVSLFPNPARYTLQVEINAVKPQHLLLKYFDLAGKVIKEESISVSGTSKSSLSTDNLPAGLYFLELSDGTRRMTRKFVVQ